MRGRLGAGKPVAVVIVIALIAFRLYSRLDQREEISYTADETHRVKRVVDGDTLLLEGGTRVRLLGVDTPETKHPDGRPPEPFGPEATEFTRRHVEGKVVNLQFDRERRDQFDRVLAYVYRDNWMLNEELIRAGLSRAETRFSYSSAMKRQFKTVEAEARENQRGLWSKAEER